MGVIDRAVIQPVLWVVYISVPLLSGPLSSYPSFPALNHSHTRSVGNEWLPDILPDIVYSTSGALIFYMAFEPVLSHLLANGLWLIIVFPVWTISAPLFAFSMFKVTYFSMFILKAFWLDYSCCLRWLFRAFTCLLIKLLTQSVIVAFKNRRSCQLLSVIASVLMGIFVSSSANKFLAIIPLVVGFTLTIPDFDLEPDVKFKFRFTRFVTCNMDEKSIEKLLDSKHCKMLCCNEMMPSLADLQSPLFSCFVKREDRQYCDSIVNPRYEIGLGSVTTWSNEHQISVVVSTPRCGIKKMTMWNTALSRYNLHKSAAFWRDNPRLGILNFGEVRTHCISTEEWIKCCGSEEFIFATFDHHGEVC